MMKSIDYLILEFRTSYYHYNMTNTSAYMYIYIIYREMIKRLEKPQAYTY